jgi:hypothetical protein
MCAAATEAEERFSPRFFVRCFRLPAIDAARFVRCGGHRTHVRGSNRGRGCFPQLLRAATADRGASDGSARALPTSLARALADRHRGHNGQVCLLRAGNAVALHGSPELSHDEFTKGEK